MAVINTVTRTQHNYDYVTAQEFLENTLTYPPQTRHQSLTLGRLSSSNLFSFSRISQNWANTGEVYKQNELHVHTAPLLLQIAYNYLEYSRGNSFGTLIHPHTCIQRMVKLHEFPFLEVIMVTRGYRKARMHIPSLATAVKSVQLLSLSNSFSIIRGASSCREYPEPGVVSGDNCVVTTTGTHTCTCKGESHNINCQAK